VPEADRRGVASGGSDLLTGAAGSGGGERLVRLIVEIAGEYGLRGTIAYAAVARLALSAQRGERDQLATWRQVSAALVELVG